MDYTPNLPAHNGCEPRFKDIPLSDIAVDAGCQSRAAIDPGTVDDYSDAIRNGTQLPPAIVFHDGTTFWLADGFHRRAAHAKAGSDTMRCDVRTGTRRDAVLYSVSANATHGLPRTSADKRRAVQTLLSDSEWGTWSNRQIASACAVSESFVRSVRADSTDVTAHRAQRTFVNRYGQTATMDTARIGRKPESPPEPTQLDNEGCSDFTQDSTGEPWDEFNARVATGVELLKQAKARLSDVLGYDPRRDAFGEPWAAMLSPSGAIKSIDTVIDNIVGYLPAEKSNRPPGFLTAHQSEIRNGVRKAGGR
jgi:hypothetical protein